MTILAELKEAFVGTPVKFFAPAIIKTLSELSSGKRFIPETPLGISICVFAEGTVLGVSMNVSFEFWETPAETMAGCPL